MSRRFATCSKKRGSAQPGVAKRCSKKIRKAIPTMKITAHQRHIGVDEEDKPFAFLWILMAVTLALVVLPILYFFSLAPLHDLADRELISGKSFNAISAPFRWLAQLYPPLHDLWSEYWDWWRDNSPTHW